MLPLYTEAHVCICVYWRGLFCPSPISSVVFRGSVGNEAMFKHQDLLISELELGSETLLVWDRWWWGVHVYLFPEDSSVIQEFMHTCVWDAASMLEGEVSSHIAIGIT